MQRRVSARVREIAELRGWHIRQVWQPPFLFPDDGRRHKRVAVPSDPWRAALGDSACPFSGRRMIHGQGATPDEAVLAAIPSDLRSAMARLGLAVDSLRDCLQK